MDVALFFCVLLFVILILVLINKIDSIVQNQKRQIRDLSDLRNELKQFTENGNSVKLSNDIKEQENNVKSDIPNYVSKISDPTVEKPIISANSSSNPVSYYKEIKTPKFETIQKTTFNNPVSKPKDWEKFIGENILSKIGIVILVLGLGFFVKFAIDNNWIGLVGRVLIGLACGSTLLGIAYFLKQKYKDFSAILSGGGFAVYYLTITIAYQIYHLFSQPVAFIAVLVITIFSVISALIYDREDLALFSLIGGFTSPFMISSGSNNYIVLFSYLIILDLGMLVLAFYKKWEKLVYIDFIGTMIILFAWIGSQSSSKQFPYQTIFLFATFFYVLFFMMVVVNNLKTSKKFKDIEFSLLLSNIFIYFSLSYWLLGAFAVDFRGLFCLILALVHFITMRLLSKNQSTDSNLINVLLGIVVTFVSLSAPIQLNGNHLSLFWSAETTLLFWLYVKTKMNIFKHSSALLLFVSVFCLIYNWIHLYQVQIAPNNMDIILNKAFLTSCVSIVSFVIYRNLTKKLEPTEFVLLLSASKYSICVEVLLLFILYFAAYAELSYQLLVHNKISIVSSSYIGLLSYGFIAILMVYYWFKKRALFYIGQLGFLVPITYLLYYNIDFSNLRDMMLYKQNVSSVDFYLRYFSICFLFICLYFEFTIVKYLYSDSDFNQRYLVWFLSFIIVFAFSAELVSIWTILNFENPQNGTWNSIKEVRKVGFPVLWGVLSFLAMYLGMNHKNKQLRLISLSLFSLAVLKLFLIDVWQMSPIGKIISFLSLGFLLLIVSFLYQKLKQILFDEDQNIIK